MVGPHWLPSRSRRIYRLTICILGGFIFLSACKSDRTPELLGAWQATLLVEEGDTIDVILDDVGLYFDIDGKYIYTSTLDYEESGKFRSKGDMLFTTPTNQDTIIERPVEIAMLSENDLHLHMKEGDKNRILEFERILELDSDPSQVNPSHGEHNHDHEDHNHVHDHGLEEGQIDSEIDTTGIGEIDD